LVDSFECVKTHGPTKPKLSIIATCFDFFVKPSLRTSLQTQAR